MPRKLSWDERLSEEQEGPDRYWSGALRRFGMVTYVIYENPDSTERGISPKDRRLDSWMLQKDTNGKPMTVVVEFEARTWEEAMQRYNDHYGYGKYIPME